jgi:formate dehydrogenase
MGTEERVTYCRICEPLCGLVVTVEDDEVTQIRPDRDHPLSRGFACPKGIAMAAVQNDPDRVTHPLRRREDGSFERVSWELALDDIGRRLKAMIDRHGRQSVGWYFGNPSAFSYSHPIWVKGFMDAIGSRHLYSAGSQDVNNRFVASALMYGSPVVVPIPDLARTELLLIVGANPLVSHGSVLTAPRIKDQLHGIVERGGRIVVVDPRRSETADAFEHVAIRPDTDVWLLLSLLQVIFEERLEDADAIARQARGARRLRELVAGHPPEETEARTGIPSARVRALARDLAGAGRAAVYGRTGSCLGRHGTLVSFLLDALNLVTGNLDREGGAIFGTAPIEFERLLHAIGADSYGRYRSRIGGLPEVLGSLPATLMAKEMTTPGEGQMRAFFVSSGNPVLSVPNGAELEAALEDLDLVVAIDLYVNDTARHADYVLPATTFLEREDFPAAFLTFSSTPFVQWTDAVVKPRGEARQEWEIIEAISRRIGVTPSSALPARWLGKLGLRFSPARLIDLVLRTGPKGDLFGLRRGGLSIAKLRRHPHGIVLGDRHPVGVLSKKIFNKNGFVCLDPEAIVAEIAALETGGDECGEFPLRLIGLRELRSHNSWMHNVPKLMTAERTHSARIHPDDAGALGIADGEDCRVVSADGAIELPARLTDEISPGTIAIPHGWGHRGEWRRANAAGGANVNALASSAPGDLERLAGMALLNGIPVRLEPVRSAGAGGELQHDQGRRGRAAGGDPGQPPDSEGTAGPHRDDRSERAAAGRADDRRREAEAALRLDVARDQELGHVPVDGVGLRHAKRRLGMP